MDKQQAVEAMTRYVLEMNRSMGRDQGMTDSQLEPMLQQMIPQLMEVNSNIYELLVDMGYIK